MRRLSHKSDPSDWVETVLRRGRIAEHECD